jgi:hypothetical protein
VAEEAKPRRIQVAHAGPTHQMISGTATESGTSAGERSAGATPGSES